MSQARRRADARHRSNRSKTELPGEDDAGNPPADGPPSSVSAEPPEVVRRLEELDDAIFEAINGSDDALEQARQLWPKLVRELGWLALEESREQYLRFAISVWRDLRTNTETQVEQTIAAIEIIELLAADSQD